MRRFTEESHDQHRRSRSLIRILSWSALAAAVLGWGLLSGALSLRTPDALKFHVWVPVHRDGVLPAAPIPEAPGFRPPHARTPGD